MSATRAASIVLVFSTACLGVEPIIDTSNTFCAGGEHAFTVTNKSSQSLTGMVLRVNRQPPGFSKDVVGRFLYDSVINDQQPALETDQGYTFHIGNDRGELHPMQVLVESAIFSDGSALGDLAAIQALWHRRELMFTEYREALDLADRSMAGPSDRASPIKALTELKEAKAKDTAIPSAERMALINTCNSVISNLRTAPNDVSAHSIVASMRKTEADRETAFQKQAVPAQVRER